MVGMYYPEGRSKPLFVLTEIRCSMNRRVKIIFLIKKQGNNRGSKKEEDEELERLHENGRKTAVSSLEMVSKTNKSQ